MAFLALSMRVGPRNSGGVTQTGFVQGFIGSQFVLDALCAVAGFIVAYDATVSALETGFAGFFETAFV